MNCAQLSKDLEELKKSRDTIQGCLDSAKENGRGRTALYKKEKSCRDLSFVISNRYLEDFEKQYPNMWFRIFNDMVGIENIDWEKDEHLAEQIDSIGEKIDNEILHFNCSIEGDCRSSDISLINALTKIKRPNSFDGWQRKTTITAKDAKGTPVYDYDVYEINESDEIIAIKNYFSPEKKNTIQCFTNNNGTIYYDRKTEMESSFVSDPYSLLALDNQTFAVGCKDGGIYLLTQLEDGSWCSEDYTKWRKGDNPKMFRRGEDIALYNDRMQCALLHTVSSRSILYKHLHRIIEEEGK